MKFKAADFFMVRIPMFSSSYLEDRTKLKEFFDNDIFLEGIQIASPDLYHRIQEVKKQEKNINQNSKVINSLYKYAIRATSRTTPFGLFCGFCIGMFNEKTDLIVDDRNKYIKRARADMEWINEVICELEKDSEVLNSVKIYTNTSVYNKGNRLVNPYLCGKNLREKKEIDIIASIRYSPIVKYVLDICENGITYMQLKEKLLEKYKVDCAVIDKFMMQLLNSGFILTELRMPKANIDAVEYLCQLLKIRCRNHHLVSSLEEVKRLVIEYNNTKVGEGIQILNQLQSKMKSIFENKNYLQVDLKVSMKECTLSNTIKEDLEQLITKIVKISRCVGDYSHIYEYKKIFLEHYGPYTEVPILELLDSELGIGAPAGYTYPSSEKIIKKDRIKDNNWGAKEIKDYLTAHITYANYSGKHDLELTDKDVEYMENIAEIYGSKYEFSSLEMYFMIFASSKQGIDEGNYKIAIGPNIGADKAGKTLGRFADMLKESEKDNYNSLYHRTNSVLADECLLVELVEEPLSSRVGNITLNYNDAKYQTTIGCMGNNNKIKIKLGDIVVGIDQKTNAFYLKSKKYNKKVKFMAFNMLNPLGTSNLYRFMREISSTGDYSFIRLIHGLDMENSIYIPRIIYKNYILSPRLWKITSEIINNPTNYDEFVESFEGWREKWNLPNIIYQKQLDDLLLIDLNNPDDIKNLFRSLKRDKIITFADYGEDENWIFDNNGKPYFAEFVVPFIANKKNESHYDETMNKVNVLPTKSDYSKNKCLSRKEDEFRVVTPGKEGWWYLKLYCADRNEKTLLCEEILPFIEKNIMNHSIEQVFFIRYADPDLGPHIRVRIKLTDKKDYMKVIDPWVRSIKEQAKISLFNINLYEREIERYGGIQGYRAVESYFCLDSLYVMNLLKLKESNEYDELLVIMNNLFILDLFGLSLDEKVSLFENYFKDLNHYKKEFKALTKDCIEMQKNPNELLPLQRVVNSNKAHVIKLKQLFDERNEKLKRYIEIIMKCDEEGKLTNSMQDILLSLIHMHCNRFKGDNVWERKVFEYTYRSVYAFRNYKKYMR